MRVTMHQAKTQLSQLCERAVAGEEVLIVNGRDPSKVFRIMPVHDKPQRKLGFWKGETASDLTPNWDSPEVNEEVTRLFEGGEDA